MPSALLSYFLLAHEMRQKQVGGGVIGDVRKKISHLTWMPCRHTHDTRLSTRIQRRMKNSRGSEGFLLRKSRFYSASEASGQSQNTGIQKNIPTKGFFSFPLMAALSPFLLSKIRTYFFFSQDRLLF